jgi:hypothetical protein
MFCANRSLLFEFQASVIGDAKEPEVNLISRYLIY